VKTRTVPWVVCLHALLLAGCAHDVSLGEHTFEGNAGTADRGSKTHGSAGTASAPGPSATEVGNEDEARIQTDVREPDGSDPAREKDALPVTEEASKVDGAYEKADEDPSIGPGPYEGPSTE